MIDTAEAMCPIWADNMTTEGFGLEIKGKTLLLTLDNPPANTWTVDRLNIFYEIIERADQDSDIWSLVITGEGNKFFCAGADLNQFASGDKEHARRAGEAFGKAFERLSRFGGVTVAAINGFAMGGGFEVALACDFRVVETQAKLGLPEAKVGLLPCAGGTQNLTRLAGEAIAKRIILLSEHVSAEQALAYGIADAISPSGEAVEQALAMCEKSLAQSPVSIRACKALIQGTRTQSHSDVLIAERDKFVDLFDFKDTTEGVNAFLEKRQAEWSNQ